MSKTYPKIAIYYDWLNQWGGAEKVLLSLLKLYPKAPVYTLVHDSQNTPWLPPKTKIITSSINRLPYASKNLPLYALLYDLALEQFDFSQFDIVISTTSTIGHCLLTLPKTLFVCYFHNINRHLYEYKLLKFYQKIDKIYSHRPDAILCNSKTVASRIQNIYSLTPQIINPGIDTQYFLPTTKLLKTNYYLVVSRLVPHKKIDIVIKAFKNIDDQLIIVGTGRQKNTLKKLSANSKNIIFAGNVNNSRLLNYYQNCQALICPQLEDFGLSAIEAQSCGKPVIAYGRGGNRETIINGKTGIFFYHQTPSSLVRAIKKFKSFDYSSSNCRFNANRFSEHNFMLNFKQTIRSLWKKHQTTTF